jgi:glycosyltransferase involved in cell wall biosynthesis
VSSFAHIAALTGKTILIASQQPWGKMFVSKHHYALELARRGNKVYYLNPPGNGTDKQKGAITITPFESSPGLFLIDHNLWFPYKLKFHAMPVFHAFMKLHMNRIMKKIAQPIDIVWSFDLGHIYPLPAWKASLKIFHPVDEPLTKASIRSAEGADIIFSVTREILEKYKQFNLPLHFINHGVSKEFLIPVDVHRAIGQPLQVGFAGNLLRADLDRDIMLQVMRENPEVIFNCWGSYAAAQANMGGVQTDAFNDFITALRTLPNVKLHGPIPATELAKAIHDMDAFLICYDVEKDQSGGTNYHKIMEFLSTGKVIVSNNVTTYSSRSDLVRMVASRKHNKELPFLFKETIEGIGEYNSPGLQQVRIEFARQNSYSRQLDRIAGLLTGKTENIPVQANT